MFRRFFLLLLGLSLGGRAFAADTLPAHTFSIGTNDFLLDGQPIQIRCGEIHFARVPREYWRQRLQACKAMGLNTVCAYLFWNYHEFEPGKFEWTGQADAAEFCRIAREEGLWVILRPGPYACAEWDGGGLPWWLLRDPKIRLRSPDEGFMTAAGQWLQEVGRVLGPLQVTKGGPILMVQVENEYGSFGKDAGYMRKLRDTLVASGFQVPLFACNPRSDLKNGYVDDLSQVVNFGNDPAGAFKALRAIQPSGPLMCGEFYPGWFDTWGAPHHLGDTPRYLSDLEYMLKSGASFSIYMAHGGTTFGLWPGADRPFKPDISSYDYDAPISEAGWTGEKFQQTRDLISKYLKPGEHLPQPPEPLPVVTIPLFKLTRSAAVFKNLPKAISDPELHPMEYYDQGHGCIVYRTEIPAGEATVLQVGQAHDFAWVFMDGKSVGVMDRRTQQFSVKIPARKKPARLDVLVEAMGHVNFGKEIHDRKGLLGTAQLITEQRTNALAGPWEAFPLRMDGPMLAGLNWKRGNATGPAFWRGFFEIKMAADTFLDLQTWGKGVVWINGHCLARFWNIGPSQTAYVPGVWLKQGKNEIIILDLIGPTKTEVAGLAAPILNQQRPELDFSRKPVSNGKLKLAGTSPVYTNSFPAGAAAQEVRFGKTIEGKQFCLEVLSSQDGGPVASVAELDLLDETGASISHLTWKIAYTDSEELSAADGSASNAINGQTSDFWSTSWSTSKPGPHYLVIDLGQNTRIGGFKYTPRAGAKATGRIKDCRIFIGSNFLAPTN